MVKISNLPVATTPLDGTEELALVQGGETRKTEVGQLAGYYFWEQFAVGGTQVVAIPAARGEWRTLYRGASNANYITTINPVDFPPSAANGAVLWANGGWSVADAITFPSSYEFYVGSNSIVELIGHVQGNRDRGLNMDTILYPSGFGAGCMLTYDRLQGTARITCAVNADYTAGKAMGRDGNGVTVINGYWDAFIRELG